MKRINTVIMVVAIAMTLVFAYFATIRDGWYLTYDDGVETHWFYKIDVFGNKRITGNRHFYR